MALQPVGADFDGELAVGQIANTEEGPLIGVDYGTGPITTYLATTDDLDSLPLTVPVGPDRVLDTRRANLRVSIVGMSSPSALDASFRLRGGSWIDVALEPDNGTFLLFGAFMNLTAVGPATSGFLTVYPPDADERPLASTLNFLANANLANGTYVAPSVVSGAWAVRIFTSQTTHIVLDLTGLTVSLLPDTGEGLAAKKPARLTRRLARQAKLRSRLAKSVGQRAGR